MYNEDISKKEVYDRYHKAFDMIKNNQFIGETEWNEFVKLLGHYADGNDWFTFEDLIANSDLVNISNNAQKYIKENLIKLN